MDLFVPAFVSYCRKEGETHHEKGGGFPILLSGSTPQGGRQRSTRHKSAEVICTFVPPMFILAKAPRRTALLPEPPCYRNRLVTETVWKPWIGAPTARDMKAWGIAPGKV